MSIRKYIMIVLMGTAIMLGLITVLNVLVDPLWRFGGNRITHENYPLQERWSKIYDLSHRYEQYDCLILGSSRASLLPAPKINGYSCYNLSVAGGRAPEQLQLARYALNRMPNVKLIIVSVEEFQFWLDGYSPKLPPFIWQNEQPPTVWKSYAALSTARMSLRMLLRYGAPQRIYDRHLIAHTRTPRHRYNTQIDPEKIGYDTDYDPSLAGPYYHPFTQLPVQVIGFAPPRSAYFTAHMQLRGDLETYLDGLYSASQTLGTLYDFSLPTPITADEANSYDGSHFHPAPNAQIARQLSGLLADPNTIRQADAIAVHELTRAELSERYQAALNKFAAPPVQN